MENNTKIDKLYEKNLTFQEIMENPIFQPVSQASAIYESQGLVISRALLEYQKATEEIKKLMDENPTYQQTIMMSKIRKVLDFSQQIIHSQDVQRESAKRCLNDVLNIVQIIYEKKSVKECSPNIETKTGNMNTYIKDSFDKQDMEELSEQEKEKKFTKEKDKIKIAKEEIGEHLKNNEELTEKEMDSRVDKYEEIIKEIPKKEEKKKRGRPQKLKKVDAN